MMIFLKILTKNYKPYLKLQMIIKKKVIIMKLKENLQMKLNIILIRINQKL